MLLMLLLSLLANRALAQQATPLVEDLKGPIPDYIKNQETFSRMVTLELDDKEFQTFGLQYGVGNFPSRLSPFAERDLGKTIPGIGYVHRVREGRKHHLRIFLRNTMDRRISLRLGRTLYDIPEDSDFRGVVTTTRIAPPPILWDKLHGASNSFFSEATKLRIMQASVRVGFLSGMGGGTVVEPPEEFRDKLDPGELLILCSGHQIPDLERHGDLFVDVPILQGLTSIGYERLRGTYLVSSEGSGIGDHGSGDCGWLKFRPGKRIPPQIPLAETNRWYHSQQDLMQVGCPKGNLPEWRMTSAVFADRNHIGGRVSLALPSVGGHSGGGIFDADGYLVAVLVHTSNGENNSYSFGTNLVDHIGKRTYQRSGHVSGAWHPSTAIDVARRYFRHVPTLREQQFIELSKEVFANLPEEERRIAQSQFNSLLLTIEKGK
jgi:hypothetical protein